MTSYKTLPADLIKLLTRFPETFAATSSRFQRHILAERGVDEDEWPFARVCELCNTLEELSCAEDPLARLAELQCGSCDDPESRAAVEEFLSVMLNAEFALFDLYRQYPLTMNPALSHWISTCLGFAELETQRQNEQWDIGQRVAQIRVAFIKGILSGNAAVLARTSPQEFVRKGANYEVRLGAFRDALLAQGIDPKDLERTLHISSSQKWADMEPPGFTTVVTDRTRTSASGQKMAQHEMEDGFREIQAQLSAIIKQGIIEELSSELVKQLLTHLGNNVQLFYSLPPDILSSEVLHKLFTLNPTFARGIILLYLGKGDDEQRRDLMTALESLPVTLPTLDMLSELISKTALLRSDEVARLVHNILENGIRVAENVGLAAGGVAQSSKPPGYPYRDGGGSAVSAYTRQVQARQIQLLCLFIQGLLSKDVVELRDVYYQIQDMGVKFMFVKEARDLWKTYCAG